jgi:hypothetical protein
MHLVLTYLFLLFKLAGLEFDFKKNKEKILFFKNHFPKIQLEEFLPFL